MVGMDQQQEPGLWLSRLGPHSPAYTRDVARTLTDAVSVLGTAVHVPEGLEEAADIRELWEELERGLAGLPRVLTRTGEWLRAETAVGRLEVDAEHSRGHVSETQAVVATEVHLQVAAEAVQRLQEALLAAVDAADVLHRRKDAAPAAEGEAAGV